MKWSLLLAVVAAVLLFCAPVDAGDAPDLLWYGPVAPSGLRDAEALGADATQKVIDVPAFFWRDGCSPTSGGMVMAYWDGLFPSFVPGEVQSFTDLAARQLIASHRQGEDGAPRHYEDYALPRDDGGLIRRDRSELPVGDEHPDDCVADFFGTSRSVAGLAYGWTWGDRIPPGLVSYAQSRGFIATTERIWYHDPASWLLYKAEIDAGRPVMLVVDASGDGRNDHSMVGVGYAEADGVRQYAAHTTWDYETHFFTWRPNCDGERMTVGLFDTFRLEPRQSAPPVPVHLKHVHRKGAPRGPR